MPLHRLCVITKSIRMFCGTTGPVCLYLLEGVRELRAVIMYEVNGQDQCVLCMLGLVHKEGEREGD